jgi:hypothetical protein
LTNNVGLQYAIEASLGLLPGETSPNDGNSTADWFTLEPNELSGFGATITTVARDPISQNRQRRKGTVTDLDSAVEFGHDITGSVFRDFIEGFCFATGINSNVTQLLATAVVDGGGLDDEFTLDAALVAAQNNKLVAGALVWASGFDTAANNGLHEIATNTTTDTSVPVPTGTLTAETGQSGRVSFAGWRIQASDTVTWTWNAGSKEATLNETGVGTQLIALGLTAGQLVHIGSIASFGGSIQNAFENSSANDMFGYARVKSITADDVVFDKVDSALQFTDATDPTTDLDIVFGEFIRNVSVSDNDFLERSFQMETTFPNLGDGTVGNTDTAYQYARGNFCNTASFSLPLTDKASVTFAMVGTDTANPGTTRQPNAASGTLPTQTAAFNTSSDIARLRITEADEDGITTDFKSLTLTLNNNVSPEKVLGQLGAKFLNTGNFEVEVEAQLLFTNPLVINKIRDNETVTMDFILKNDDGIIGVDIPSMTLGGGDREFPVNESVLLNTTGEAFGDASLNTSIGISIIPIPFA